MSKNIKEIGKELMGKSLNSFHRKTGLTQLEKNNEMQDGILNGILSQVDDAYIEKTEQSNVIHLDGSGDGVVVLDSIEGNTMVNLFGEFTFTNNFIKYGLNGVHIIVDKTNANTWATSYMKKLIKKPTTQYTYVVYVDDINGDAQLRIHKTHTSSVFDAVNLQKGLNVITFTTMTPDGDFYKDYIGFTPTTSIEGVFVKIKYIMLLEGDWTNKEIPPYFEGLQSSFEEKVNDEDKYEIEILSHKGRPNELKNSFNELQASPREYMFISITDIAKKYLGKRLVVSGKVKSIGKNGDVRIYSLGKYSVGFSTLFNCNTSNYINFVCEGRFTYETNGANGEVCHLSFYGIYDSGIFPCVKDIKIEILDDNDNILATEWCPNYKDDEIHWKNHKNSNKIKLLINEPLRSVPNGARDRLCVKENKLFVERNCYEYIITGNEDISRWREVSVEGKSPFRINADVEFKYAPKVANNNKGCFNNNRFINQDNAGVYYNKNGMCLWKPNANHFKVLGVCFDTNQLTSDTIEGCKQWFKDNKTVVVCELEEPIYEEVLNEYGEPIILEGYENGTLYIDSTIIPTTTVKYTPKMESFNTLKEVANNNIMLTNDVNDNIIPYMMDVDLMIMEKEMALMSHKNIRKMEVLDMTSMQKRTQDMLERLIKGKSLTEQECKTRVTTYLHAGKITDEQAEELMLLIDEVYA